MAFLIPIFAIAVGISALISAIQGPECRTGWKMDRGVCVTDVKVTPYEANR